MIYVIHNFVFSSLYKGLAIGFLRLNYVVQEQDSDFILNIALFKSLESEQTYHVRLIGIPISAENDDFSVPAEVLLFPPESEILTVFVNIIGDTRIEQTEQFAVRLRYFGSPAFQFEPDTISAIIDIEDNDIGKFFRITLITLCSCVV